MVERSLTVWAGRRWAVALAAVVAGATVALAAAPRAEALEGYRDRRGLYGGFHVGGAAAMTPGNTDPAITVGTEIGGGATRTFTVGLNAELSLLLDGGSNQTVVFRPAVDARFFAWQGLHFDALVGLAWWSVSQAGDKAGFAAGGVVGYEFFVSARGAVDVQAGFEHHFLKGDDANMGTVRFGMRWY